MEVCEHYAETGKPLGPQIHLDSAGHAAHSVQLHVWETFVLAHEIGHIAAGHLESEALWHAEPALAMLDVYQENSSHAKEAEADLLGYTFTRNSILKNQAVPGSNSTSSTDDGPLFLLVIKLFDLLYLIGSRQSDSHPDPIDRLCNICLAVYGEDAAEKLAESYSNQEILVEMLGRPLLPKR
jgi:hypothetical protein